MADSLTNTPEVQLLLNRAAGLDQPGGNERLKRIVHRVATDMCRIVEDFDVTPSEFWTAVSYLTRLGQAKRGQVRNRWSRALPGRLARDDTGELTDQASTHQALHVRLDAVDVNHLLHF